MSILNSYGLADMTMRRVATSLSVAPGALYWHISNKQELISAIAGQILSPVLAATAAPSEETAEPEQAVEKLYLSLKAHRDGAELVSAALAQPGSALWVELNEFLSSRLESALPQADTEERIIAAKTIIHFVLGATMLEQSREYIASNTQAAPAVEQAENTESTPVESELTSEMKAGVAIILRGLAAS